MTYKKYFPGIIAAICFMSLLLAGCEGGTVPENGMWWPHNRVVAKNVKSAVGYINVSPLKYHGVRFTDSYTHLFGHAWGENIGWISFGSSSCYDGDDESYDEDSGLPYYEAKQNIYTKCWGVNLESAVIEGNIPPVWHLSGYGWSSSIGWINFGQTETNTVLTYDSRIPTDYIFGVSMNKEGHLRGCAWSDVIGWIIFNFKMKHRTSE